MMAGEGGWLPAVSLLWCDLCPGWIIKPKLPPCDEPQQISLCQWVVERLHTVTTLECVFELHSSNRRKCLSERVLVPGVITITFSSRMQILITTSFFSFSHRKLQKAEQDQGQQLLLRHYESEKAKPKDRRANRKTQPSTLVDGIPQIPEVTQQNPAQQKLHYRINDGSSFI